MLMARPNKTRRRLNGNQRYAHIVGWGVEIPKRIMTNDDLTEFMDTNDEWIRTRTGIKERRIADDRDTTVTLGLRAARKALAVADVLPEDVELIIVATSSPTHLFPATANMMAKMAHGIADDLLSTTVVGADCPVMLAPAMNARMWGNSILQGNLQVLRKAGYVILASEQ